MRVEFGVERFASEQAGRSSRAFGLLTNDSACASGYVPSRQHLLEHGITIKRLFSPEHGMQASGRDGARMDDTRDALTGLPVTSLYGEHLAPTQESLAGLDAVLVDLPDVGSRPYTYLWTLTHLMESCAVYRKPLIVLDRPNPISGLFGLVEGPMLDEATCSSFIGRWSLPLRHSCTFGELARFWQATRLRSLDLTVVPAEGWRREMFYPDYMNSFVPTSPAIGSFETCLLYPGMCLLEATNLNEGRGTPLAFRVAGAPWLNAIEIATRFNRLRLEGVVARATEYEPCMSRYAGKLCRGVLLHPSDPRCLQPVRAAMSLIALIRSLHPEWFAWAGYATHANPTGREHLDRLLGVPNAASLFQSLLTDTHVTEEVFDCRAWEAQMSPYLLYPGAAGN